MNKNEQPLRDKQYYLNPQTFKNMAVRWVDNFENFESAFNGENEFDEFGEKTLWLDPRSIHEISLAYKQLIEAVRAAKVIKVKPHLTLIK